MGNEADQESWKVEIPPLPLLRELEGEGQAEKNVAYKKLHWIRQEVMDYLEECDNEYRHEGDPPVSGAATQGPVFEETLEVMVDFLLYAIERRKV